MLFMVSFENTDPAGLLGELITSTFVRAVTAASSDSGVISYPVDASATIGTGRPPARWTIGAYDTQPGSWNRTSSPGSTRPMSVIKRACFVGATITPWGSQGTEFS